MPGYVPPHRRGGGGDGPPPPSRDGPPPSRGGGGWGDRDGDRGGDRRDFGRFGGDRGGGGFDRGPPRGGGGFDRGPPRGGGGGRAEPGPAVFPDWQPSARVLALDQAQIDSIRARLNMHVQDVDDPPRPVPPPIETFTDMNLHELIMRDINHHGYDRPTPIQAAGIPTALAGRDILGCAETGSGKTASFSIPLVQHCLNQPKLRAGNGPIALVLAPTRELAQQIQKEVSAFARSSNIKAACVVGGVPMQEQMRELHSGVECIVATPGRFIDHLQQRNTSLSRVSYVVLDEADRMLDMGFEPQIREVMRELPKLHQTLLFSATMPPEIEALTKDYLNRPSRLKIGQVSTPTANVSQRLTKTTHDEKIEHLVHILLEEINAAKGQGSTMPLTIVFVERKAKCDDVADALNGEGIRSAGLHGGRTQSEREAALADFSSGCLQVLVATDVASRGLDIKGIGHVINLDLPRTFEDYVHRIGRTGRAGTAGRATSLYTEHDAFLVGQIQRALRDLEAGNRDAFATGKEARRKERELAQQFKESMRMNNAGLVQSASGGASVQVSDKYRFMASSTTGQPEGAADDAWDD